MRTAYLFSFLLAATAATLIAAPGSVLGQSAPATAEAADDGSAAAMITSRSLRLRVEALAHDSMRGRDTPSPELEKTARYVADAFRSAGLRPGAGDGYLQAYPVTLVRAGSAARQWFRLRGPEGEHTLDPRTEFIAVPVARRADADAPLVALAPDDRTTRLRGEIAVIATRPATMQAALGRARELLSERGAAGLIVAVREAPEEYVRGLREYLSSERASLGEPVAFPGPVVIVPASALPEPLAAALTRGGALPAGWSARLHTEADVGIREAYNTVGWLPGSDPELRDEYIVFTAHMDHVGVGRPVDGDSIYNGADDNASGTATILALAEAFARTRPAPARSLVFMTVSGEEKGLWGSRWYTENPTFPLDRTVANINIDMIGRNWPDTVVAIGRTESTLGETADAVAAAHPELGLALIDDPWPEERFYFRSDHVNFARKGIPILFFFSGVHEDYHRPSDEPGRIRYEKAARIGRLIYHLGREVADAPERPRWDEAAYRRIVEESGPR